VQRCRAYSPAVVGRPGSGAAPHAQLDGFAEQARGGAAEHDDAPEDGGYEALREDAARSRQDFWGLDQAGDEDDDDDEDDVVEQEVRGLVDGAVHSDRACTSVLACPVRSRSASTSV
jgi:hypothetical protein